MLFLTMGFVCLFYENKFMLISGDHIANRSIYMLIALNVRKVIQIEFVIGQGQISSLSYKVVCMAW